MRSARADRVTAWCLATLLLPSSLTAGCSFMFVDGPKRDETRLGGWAPCTTSNAWPIVDTLLTGWFLLNLILNANKPAAEFGMSGEATKTVAIATGVTLSGLAGISAGVGFSRVSACNESLADEPVWRPTPPPRRRFVPPPPPPSPGLEQPAPASPGQAAPPYPGHPAPVPGAPGSAAPQPGPGVSPPPPTVPAVPAAPPAQQVDDDEQPRPGAKPRSGVTLPATEPLLAAMPRLHPRSGEPARPTFDGLPRLVHPWALVLAPAP